MIERRRFVRLHSKLSTTYKVIDKSQPDISHTKNVGGGGIRFATEQKFHPGTLLDIEIKFPDRISPMRFTGQVVWSDAIRNGHSAKNPGEFDTGITFAEIEVQDREFIIQHAALYL